MSGSVEEVPVLIVGAGPAGLAAAATLARHGVEVLLVDRRTAPSDHPRATAVSTWSMELLRSWGLEGEVRAGEIDVEWRGWVCETLGSDGVEIPLGYPTREQSAAISPAGPACVPQDHLEPVLLRHVRALGARTRLGAELVGLESRPDGVEAVLRDGAGGPAWRARARYLVGADGAHSTVRRLLDVPMRGPGVLGEGIAALFHAPLWPLVGDRRYGLYPITHPRAAGVFLPAGRGDRWLYGRARERGAPDPTVVGEEEMARLIRRAAGAPRLHPRIERIETFAYTAQLADRFRDGGAFLAGDAARGQAVRGGTGMNTAIRDGHDLGWKLAWVLGGWAGPELLDSYEAERRPVAAHNVARSVDPDGSVREVSDELHVDLGGRIPHLWLDGPGGRRSTLDLLGPGFTRFTGPCGDASAYAAGAARRAAPVTVRRLPALVARALGIAPHGSRLVRPDGVPAPAMPGVAAAAA